MTRRTSGVVLPGGVDTLDDAALLGRVEGAPVARRVADRLASLTDELVVNCRRERRDAVADALDGATHDPRFALDTVPDRGPVYGLRTALRVAAGEYAVVVGAYPHVDPTLLAYLHNRTRSEDVGAVVPRVDGRRRPRCAVYRVDPGREACEVATRRPDPSFGTVLDGLRVAVVDEATVFEYAPADSFEPAE